MRSNWIEETASLRDVILRLEGAERSAAIEHHASRSGLARNTIYRQLRAVAFLDIHAQAEALRHNQVHASLVAVERLRHLDRLDPAAALRVRRAVLTGSMSQAAISQIVESYVPTRLTDTEATHKAMLTDYYLGAWDAYAVKGSPSMSEEGALLRVDLELLLKPSDRFVEGDRAAIFISPTAEIYGERAQFRTFTEQMVAIVASLHLYKDVMVIASDKERDMLSAFLLARGLAENVRVMGLRNDLEERARMEDAK